MIAEERYSFQDISLATSLVRQVLGSIVVSIPACHAGDRGSIPRRGGTLFRIFSHFFIFSFPVPYICRIRGSDGGRVKYVFQGTTNAKNLPKKGFLPSDVETQAF